MPTLQDLVPRYVVPVPVATGSVVDIIINYTLYMLTHNIFFRRLAEEICIASHDRDFMSYLFIIVFLLPRYQLHNRVIYALAIM